MALLFSLQPDTDGRLTANARGPISSGCGRLCLNTHSAKGHPGAIDSLWEFPMLNAVSRRTFFVGAATAAGALSVAGANERVRLGLIGSGGRGQHLVNMARQAGGAQFVAICDAWDQRMNAAEKVIEAPVEHYKTYSALLDRKDIDAVIVATTDHHHAHVGVDACRAGKDVFVEKPMTSLPMQGHEMVKAVRENKRIVQVGVQQRSIAPFIAAKKAFSTRAASARCTWCARSGTPTAATWRRRRRAWRRSRRSRLGDVARLAAEDPLGPQALLQSLRLLGFLDRRADRRTVCAHGGRRALVSRLEQTALGRGDGRDLSIQRRPRHGGQHQLHRRLPAASTSRLRRPSRT